MISAQRSYLTQSHLLTVKIEGGVFGAATSLELWVLDQIQIWIYVASVYHLKRFLLGAVQICIFGFSYTQSLCVISLLFLFLGNFSWGNFQWQFNIFISVHRIVQVEIGNVGAHEFFHFWSIEHC